MVVCPECGAQVSDRANHCRECGAPVDQSGTRQSGQHRGQPVQQNQGQGHQPAGQQGGGRQAGQGPPRGQGGQPPGQASGPRAGNRPQQGYEQPAGQPAGQGQNQVYQQGYRDAGVGMVPPGIKFVCMVMGVFGGFLLLAGGISADMGGIAATAGASETGSMLGNLGSIFMLIGIGSFGGIYGLWHRKTWGWLLTVGLFGVGSLLSLTLLAGASGQGTGMVLLIVQGGIVAYLYTQRDLYDVEQYLPVE